MIAKNVSLTSTVSVRKNSSATLVTKQASYIPRHKDNNHPKGGSEYVGAGLAAEEELSAESEVEEEGEGEELVRVISLDLNALTLPVGRGPPAQE